MIAVKCINKIRSNSGEITHYTLVDMYGNQKILTSQELKYYIQYKQLDCINLKLTSDNRLVDSSTKPSNNGLNALRGTQQSYHLTAEERKTKQYIDNLRASGTTRFTYNQGEYAISGNDIILLKCLVKVGEFTIPFFCTKFALSDGVFGSASVAFKDCSAIKLYNRSRMTSLHRLFALCEDLVCVDLSEFDTHLITDMSYMFYHCLHLSKLNLSNFKTSNAKNMSNMFDCMGSYAKGGILDVSSFDTSKVTDMSNMFANCGAILRGIRVFNTANVKSMFHMFGYLDCHGKVLDLRNFDTRKVTDMSLMFHHVCNTPQIILSSFDTSNVRKMDKMFMECCATSIDIHTFNTAKVTSVFNAFSLAKIQNLDIRNFNFDNIKTNFNVFPNAQIGEMIVSQRDLEIVMRDCEQRNSVIGNLFIK